MSLSAHEKIEFERLTANLTLDDSGLNRMAKKDKATAMSYVALPNPSTIFMILALAGIAVTVGGVITNSLILTVLGGVSATLLCLRSCILSDNEMPAAYHKRETGK